MRDRTAIARLRRLEGLKGLLKSQDHVTAGELAAELGVSMRTLRRDLELLRESGVPVEADRGRGGGLRLQRNWALGRVHFSPAEAVDLLLSLAIAERMNSPLLLRQLAPIRRKIVAAFPEGYQNKIRALRKRVLIGSLASARVMESFVQPSKVVVGIAEAFFEMKCVTIKYVDQHGARSTRTIEPQFLYLSMPVWYVLSWDRLRKAVRYFRIDRIRSVEPLNVSFRLADPRPFLAEAEEGIETL